MCSAMPSSTMNRLSVQNSIAASLKNLPRNMTRSLVALYMSAIDAKSGNIQSIVFGSTPICSGTVKVAAML